MRPVAGRFGRSFAASSVAAMRTIPVRGPNNVGKRRKRLQNRSYNEESAENRERSVKYQFAFIRYVPSSIQVSWVTELTNHKELASDQPRMQNE